MAEILRNSRVLSNLESFQEKQQQTSSFVAGHFATSSPVLAIGDYIIMLQRLIRPQSGVRASSAIVKVSEMDINTSTCCPEELL